MPTQVRGKHLVYGAAAIALRHRMDDGSFGYDGDICRRCSDIYDRRSTLISWRNTSAKSRRKAFFHHENLADVRFFGSIEKGTLLDVSYVRDHAHDCLQ